MRLLVLNAGSSTLKLSVVDGNQRLAEETLQHPASKLDPRRLAEWAADRGPFDGVGHRLVHGGREFTTATVVDGDVLSRLEALTALAPLHQPAGLAGIRAAQAAFPALANVACFDTGFHSSLPEGAATYAVPLEWRERFGVLRYGFHGLSHAWVARRAAEVLDRPLGELRTISCHLGSGASLCAIGDGRSQDTTMGFTPLEGLVMATRSGTVDPGLVLWLQQQGRLSADEVSDGIEHHGGLAALSGTSGDMQEVLEAVGRRDRRAVLALDVWRHRLVGEIGAMAAALGGANVVVFTGGIGEHASGLRALVAGRLAYLGVSLDPVANSRGEGDRDVSFSDAACRTLVVKAGEDLQIAQEVEQLLAR